MEKDFYSYYLEDDGEELYYIFTSKDASYTVYFRPREYIEYVEKFPYLLQNTFGFGFFKFPHIVNAKSEIDNKVRNTIVKIIEDFFSNNSSDVILLYHFDYKDGKQSKRNRIFKKWYEFADSKNKFIKFDIPLIMPDGHSENYIGYLCLSNNPNLKLAHTEFESFALSFELEDKG